MLRGSCLCGAVVFEISGPMKPPVACHCRECRRQSGHHVAASEIARKSLTVTCDRGLQWYRTSDFAMRGFCGTCGATLFWRRDESRLIHVLMATLDGPTRLRLARHEWVSEKGDYYEIGDGMPQHEGFEG